MDARKIKFLFKKYPRVFAYMKMNAITFFDCKDGWFSLIEDICEKLEPLIEEFIKENYYEIYPAVSAIKEKFGILQFYMTTATDEMYRIIEAYSQKSQFICEICCEKGQIRSHKGISLVRCNKCYSKKDF